ncbi:MAG: protein kinase domain-containing protein [Burkholderiales bacterium]
MTEMLARLTVALAARYRVERELGAGGMATVFLAHDLRHERDVAIKVLHPDLGAALGAERFLSEIKTTARLQHPHILPLLDSGAADGLLYYVMPYVTGETLRARLEREGQLPVADAVRLAREVAAALDFAHRQGVVHRDIKPENILLQDGSALVADFGIALAVQQAGGARMTQTGLSLGTPQYMSPEQATGERTLDARTDVYALGAVTYEMLVGEPPFTGPSIQAIVARLLAEEPRPLVAQRKAVPAHVEAAVLQALEKLPADRFASAAEFGEALRGGTGAVTARRASAGARRGGWRRVAGLTVAAAAVAGGIGWQVGRGTGGGGVAGNDGAPSTEFALRLGAFDRLEIAISPDGRRIAQAVIDSLGRRQIAIRDLGTTRVRLVSGSDGAMSPTFSPDGDTLVYVATDLTIRRLPVAGGTSQPIGAGAYLNPAHWAPDGFVYFSKNGAGLWRVRAAGGEPAEELTRPDPQRREFTQWWPQLLPGGKHLLMFTFTFPADSSRVELLTLATRERRTILGNASTPRFVAPNRLLFMRDSSLMSVGFDPGAGAIRGEPTPVLQDVAWEQTDGNAGYDVARDGTLVYLRASETRFPAQLRWVDRSGREEAAALTEPGQWSDPRLSPDGRSVALSRFGLVRQLWTIDLERRVASQLTRGKSSSFAPVWTPDSRALIHVGETPVYDLVRTDIATGRADTVRRSLLDKYPFSVSPDGRRVAFTEASSSDNVFLLELRDRTILPLNSGTRGEGSPTFSPDGRWLAYSGIVDGGIQVFVTALDGSGRRLQLSAEGGDQPRWTRGGREVVFRRGDAVYAAPFDPQAGRAGSPVLLFRSPDGRRVSNGRGLNYDVTPDGSRFLMIVAQRRPEALPVVVVTHWTRSLGQGRGR